MDANAAVFLDRDGTIIEERNYLCRPEDVAVFPGAAGALRDLHLAGFKLFIVSNQSGIGRGYFTWEQLEAVNKRLLLELPEIQFEKIYIAPEAPDQPSRGRKPSPQFLWDARDEFGLDFTRCYMIGDKWIDLECGWNAGVARSLLVRHGYGAETERKYAGSPKFARAVVADDLAAAARWILQDGLARK